jgi:hypothetical protein
MSVIISNTTPLNYLILIDHITVLSDLYHPRLLRNIS